MEHKKETVTIKKEALWMMGTFLFAVLFVISLLTGGFSGGDNNVAPAPSGNQPTPTPSAVKVSADDDAVLGDKDAPVEIIEFSDYQCPFCSRFWSDTLTQIKSEYIDTGKVKFIYRDFPLNSIHPMAQIAAESTECVRDQGGDEAFWEMHDKIFGNQQSLSEANLKAWAQEIGYNIDSCLSSGKFESEVNKDLSDGQAAGARGTPYFVVNGQAISGAQPFSVFKQAIDAQLNA